MEVSLRSFINDKGPSRVWMALLEQHSPSPPVFHNLCCLIDAISPTAPNIGLPLFGNPLATADANQNCVTIVRHSFLFIAHSLASLTSILLSFRALFTPSIHPNLGLPLPLLPSTFAFITFFSSRSLSILSTWPKPSQYIHIYSSCQFSPHTCYRSHYFIPNPYPTEIHQSYSSDISSQTHLASVSQLLSYPKTLSHTLQSAWPLSHTNFLNIHFQHSILHYSFQCTQHFTSFILSMTHILVSCTPHNLTLIHIHS